LKEKLNKTEYLIFFLKKLKTSRAYLLVLIFISLNANQDIPNYENHYWLKLLHYENNQSIILDKSFFLAKNGNKNPKEEYYKTIESFKNDSEIICKYPARYKWINNKLNLNITKPNCDKLDKYLYNKFNKISIIFTDARYNSPGSVFGHTFLKVDSLTIPYAINYAATIPNNENTFLYAYKGLTGRYKSTYKYIPYFQKDYEYRFSEARDLISFELNLTQNEINNIMLHLFEIKGLKNNYYFLNRNCSSELLKLIDVSNENKNLSKELPYAIKPIDIIYILEKYNLIVNINRHFSRMKLFTNYLEKLTIEEQDIVAKIVNNKISIASFDVLNTLSTKTKINIILASIKIIEINSLSKEVTTKDISNLMKLISIEDKYKINNFKQENIILTSNPISNKTQKIKFGYKNSDLNNKIIGYRYMHTNRLDMLNQTKGLGSVEFIDVTLNCDSDKKTQLDKLILVNLESLPVSNLFFNELTTQIQLGLKRIEYFDDNLHSYLIYALGYNYKFMKNIYARVALEGGTYYYENEIFSVSLNPTLEYTYRNIFISELSYILKKYESNNIGYSITLSNHVKISKDSSLYMEFKKNYSKQIKSIELGYNIFF
jgi:hypothetical protein